LSSCQRNFSLTSTAHGAGFKNKIFMGKLDQRVEGNQKLTVSE
jgi:hypothetical protein